LATATGAYNAIKKAISFGQDLESQIGQVSKWLKASSDLDFIAKKSKNPSVFKKFLAKGSVEEEAFQAYTHKKKLEEQRYDLMTMLQFRYGHKAKDELIALEGKIRKQRQKEIYDRELLKQKIIETIAVVFTFVMVSGFVFWVVWLKYG
jgi:hypothetical protein